MRLTYPKTLFLMTFFLLSETAFCGTNTTTFSVNATVSANCTFAAANALSFSPYVPNAGNVNATTAILPTCTNGSTYNVGLDAGLATGATINTRKMQNGSNTLSYQLYSDSNRSVVWGNTVGTNTVAGTGTGNQQTMTVYGQIPDNQPTAPPGNYSDTITVTINF